MNFRHLFMKNVTAGNISARSAHLLRRPYENVSAELLRHPAFQDLKQARKIIRQGSRRLHIFSCPRMPETEDHGMERLALKMTGQLSVSWYAAAVDLIPQKRVPGRFHMYPDLMRPSRFQPAFDISKTFETLQHPVMRHRLLAIFYSCGHPLPVAGVPANRQIHRSLLFLNDAVYDSTVSADDAVLLQLSGNGQVGRVIFTDQKASRSIPVDPVDNAGPHNAVDPERLPRQ